MKNIIYILSALLCVGLVSCFDDDSTAKYYGSVDFHKTGLFVDYNGGSSRTQSTTFSVNNVAWLEVDEDDIPAGWEVELEFYRGVLTVTATDEAFELATASMQNPITDDPMADRVVEISFSGETFAGYTVSTTLTVGIVEYVSLADEQANSMIVTEQCKFYTFSPSYKGEEWMPSNSLNGVVDCELLWRSNVSPIKHTQLLDTGEIGFYITYDVYDYYDEDGIYDQMIPGNAVIAALDAGDNILWSWHIWMTSTDPRDDAITFNSQKFMNRNLGAEKNEIGVDYTYTYDGDGNIDTTTDPETDDLLLSYGLYYQWGRKDPFIQPMDYKASGGYDAFLIDGDGDIVEIEYEESTSSIGRLSYTIENPLTYVLGIDESSFDWLYSNHNTPLWSDTQKSIYDPSPYGWRVPRTTDLAGITIESFPTNTYVYGATLKGSDGNMADFMGCGRKTYITGRISNVNSEYVPWIGYYWTSMSSSATDYARSIAMLFSNAVLYDDTDGINTASAQLRANGMQIRCVKDE